MKRFEVGGLEYEKWHLGAGQLGTAGTPEAGILLSVLRPRRA
ncbi:MAG: hypothetical protein ACK54R_00755 [Pirellulaceae bacterium]